MTTPPLGSNPLVISHLALRRCIGVLGLALPFVLAIGLPLVCERAECDQIQGSISRYYHTEMGDVVVGALCAIGVFLIAYRGYGNKENMLATVCGVAAIGIGIFPMALDGATGKDVYSGYLHTASSAVFFLGLAIMALRFFPQPDPSSPPLPGKEKRNTVYRACGVTILIAMALMGLYSALTDQAERAVDPWDPIFWLESVAIVAFGIAWLTKGRAMAAVVDLARRRR